MNFRMRTRPVPDMNPAKITKRWKHWKGLFQRRDRIEVTANQIALPNSGLWPLTIALVTVKINGVIVLHTTAPFPMPAGEIMLPLQIFMLSVAPNSPHNPYVLGLLAKFCRKCNMPQVRAQIIWLKEPFEL